MEKVKIFFGGTTFEEILESHYDVIAAIKILLELGYTEIYLQGHSLGATKVVYTYSKLKNENSKLLENISGIILLSLIDISTTLKYFLNDKFKDYVDMASKMVQSGDNGLMPKDCFIHPISAKGFLRYTVNNKEIDCGNYSTRKKF